MRKLGLFLLFFLLLFLAACSAGVVRDHIEETIYTGELNTVEVLPDAGLNGVAMITPDSLTASVDAPTVDFSVVFTGVNPNGAPDSGRVCTVKLIRDSEVIQTVNDFVLSEGAELAFTVDYTFERYTSQNDSKLIVELDYGEDYCYKAIPVTVNDYPDEYYAMTSGDPYPYALTIITNKNVIIVYGKDENGEYTGVAKTFICSTGINTPERGTYKLLHKYEWKELIHDYWGQYSTWVTGDILIHSLPYFSPDKDNMWSWQFNRLGGSVSTGCIRMRVCDCKWIFDHCPCGTPVTFVVLNELPEGITKPTYEPLDLDSPDAGWDPTDPDPENPWHPEQPDDSWKALVPNYDRIIEANTTLDWSEYENFAKTTDIFTRPVGE